MGALRKDLVWTKYFSLNQLYAMYSVPNKRKRKPNIGRCRYTGDFVFQKERHSLVFYGRFIGVAQKIETIGSRQILKFKNGLLDGLYFKSTVCGLDPCLTGSTRAVDAIPPAIAPAT